MKSFIKKLNLIKTDTYLNIYKFISDPKHLAEIKDLREQKYLEADSSYKKLDLVLKTFKKIKEDLDEKRITKMTALRAELNKLQEKITSKEESIKFPKFEYVNISNKNPIHILEAPLILNAFLKKLTIHNLMEMGLKTIDGYFFFDKIKFIVCDTKTCKDGNPEGKIEQFINILNKKIQEEKKLTIIKQIKEVSGDNHIYLLVYKNKAVNFENVLNTMKSYKIYVR